MEIRRAYRELSKRYHPDTTDLPAAIATAQFQRLNEAYGILSSPERRSVYDLQIGYSRWNVIQAPRSESTKPSVRPSRGAYLDASDRPLSPGELFALLLMGASVVGCLILALVVGFLRGDEFFPPSALPQERLTPMEVSLASSSTASAFTFAPIAHAFPSFGGYPALQSPPAPDRTVVI